MEELLKNISAKDLEKLKMLLSIIPQTKQKEVVTLRVFIDEYSNLIKQNRSKAYYTSVECAFKHLTNFFESRNSIKSIELKDVENFMNYLQKKVRRGYGVYYRTLKAAFNKAVEWEYVKENYFVKVKLPKRQKMAPEYINSDQLELISRQLEIGNSGNKNGIVKDVVVFAFYTGMRLDEIVNLRWKNIDLRNRVITVGDENFTTKGRNQRFIPICEEVLKVIENLELRMQNEKGNNVISINSFASDQSFVFCKQDGSKYCGNYVSRKFKNACMAAGMDKSIHFHSLRHSFASSLVQKGVPLYTIKELLGHSSISTTEIYSHLNMDCLREAIKKLDESGEGQGKWQKGKAKNIDTQEIKIFRISSINQQERNDQKF